MTTGLMPVYDVLSEPLDRTAAGLQLFLHRGAVDPVWGRFVSRTDHLFNDAELIGAVFADLRNGRACGTYEFASVETAVDFVVGSTMGGIRRFVRGGSRKDRTAIRRTDAHLRTNAPGVLLWWRTMPDAASIWPWGGDRMPAGQSGEPPRS